MTDSYSFDQQWQNMERQSRRSNALPSVQSLQGDLASAAFMAPEAQSRIASPEEAAFRWMNENPDLARSHIERLRSTGQPIPPIYTAWEASQGGTAAPAPDLEARLQQSLDSILGPAQGGPAPSTAQAQPGGSYDFNSPVFNAPPGPPVNVAQGLPGREDRLDINGPAPPPTLPILPRIVQGAASVAQGLAFPAATAARLAAGQVYGQDTVDAYDAGMADTGTVGFSDEITGMLGGDTEMARAEMERLRSSNPLAFMVGQGVGTIPSMMIPGGIAAQGASIPARVGAATIGTGLPLAVYGAGSGTTPTERLQNAAVMGGLGVAGGFVAPYIANAVGAGIGAATRFFRGGPGTVPQQVVGEVLDADLIMPTNVAQHGPEAMVADVGPNTQQLAAVISALPGPGQKIVRSTLNTRAQGAGARLTNDIDAAMPSANIPRTMEALDQARKAAAAPLYRAAYATPINGSSQVFKDVLATPAGTQAWRAAVRLAANEGATLDRNFLTVQAVDYLKRALDDMHGAARSGGQRQYATALDNLRKTLLAEVDAQVPAYEAARAAYAGPSAMMEAMENGQAVFSRTTSPDELRITMSGMSQSERDAFVLGARQQVAQIMGTSRNDAAAAIRELVDKGWNKEKLTILLGRKEATQVIQAMERERTFATTASAAMSNSETARRVFGAAGLDKSVESSGIRRAYEAGGVLGLLRASGLAGVEKFFRSLNGNQTQQFTQEIARLLMAQGPERDLIINTLTRLQQRTQGNAAMSARVSKLLSQVLPRTPIGAEGQIEDGVDALATGTGYR